MSLCLENDWVKKRVILYRSSTYTQIRIIGVQKKEIFRISTSKGMLAQMNPAIYIRKLHYKFVKY